MLHSSGFNPSEVTGLEIHRGAEYAEHQQGLLQHSQAETRIIQAHKVPCTPLEVCQGEKVTRSVLYVIIA